MSAFYSSGYFKGFFCGNSINLLLTFEPCFIVEYFLDYRQSQLASFQYFAVLVAAPSNCSTYISSNCNITPNFKLLLQTISTLCHTKVLPSKPMTNTNFAAGLMIPTNDAYLHFITEAEVS